MLLSVDIGTTIRRPHMKVAAAGCVQLKKGWFLKNVCLVNGSKVILHCGQVVVRILNEKDNC